MDQLEDYKHLKNHQEVHPKNKLTHQVLHQKRCDCKKKETCTQNCFWLFLKFGDESKQGSAGVGIPVVGSTKGNMDALRVNPAEEGFKTLVIAAFLQQLSHVNCQPAVGGTGRETGCD